MRHSRSADRFLIVEFTKKTFVLSVSKHSGSTLKSKFTHSQKSSSHNLMYCLPPISSGYSCLVCSCQILFPFSATALKNFTFSIGHFVLKGMGTFISTGYGSLHGFS